MKKQRLLLLANFLKNEVWLRNRCFNRKGWQFDATYDYDPLACMSQVFPNDWKWSKDGKLMWLNQLTPYTDMAKFFDIPFIDIWILFTFKGPLCEHQGRDIRLSRLIPDLAKELQFYAVLGDMKKALAYLWASDFKTVNEWFDKNYTLGRQFTEIDMYQAPSPGQQQIFDESKTHPSEFNPHWAGGAYDLPHSAGQVIEQPSMEDFTVPAAPKPTFAGSLKDGRVIDEVMDAYVRGAMVDDYSPTHNNWGEGYYE